MSTGRQGAAPTDRNGEGIPVRASSCTPVVLPREHQPPRKPEPFQRTHRPSPIPPRLGCGTREQRSPFPANPPVKPIPPAGSRFRVRTRTRLPMNRRSSPIPPVHGDDHPAGANQPSCEPWSSSYPTPNRTRRSSPYTPLPDPGKNAKNTAPTPRFAGPAPTATVGRRQGNPFLRISLRHSAPSRRC